MAICAAKPGWQLGHTQWWHLFLLQDRDDRLQNLHENGSQNIFDAGIVLLCFCYIRCHLAKRVYDGGFAI